MIYYRNLRTHYEAHSVLHDAFEQVGCTFVLLTHCACVFANRMDGRELPLIVIARLPPAEIPASGSGTSAAVKAANSMSASTLLQPSSIVDPKKQMKEQLELPNAFVHWLNAIRKRTSKHYILYYNIQSIFSYRA